MRKPRVLVGAGLAVATLIAGLLTNVAAASALSWIPWGEELYLANAANSAGVYIQVEQDGDHQQQRIHLRLKDLAADGYQPRVQVDWRWQGATDVLYTEGPWRNTGGNGTTATYWTQQWPYTRYDGAYVSVWNGSGPKVWIFVPTR